MAALNERIEDELKPMAGRAPSNTPGITSSIEGSFAVPTAYADKIRENRLRRMAGRPGLVVRESLRRDSRVYDFGTYMIVEPSMNAVVGHGSQSGYGMSLDDVERNLLGATER